MKACATSLSSKVINTHSAQMSELCTSAVMKVANPEKNSLDLKDIKIVAKVGGTLDDTELVDGLCLDNNAMGTTRRMEKAKVALIQFQLSPPKTDMENQVFYAPFYLKLNLILGCHQRLQSNGPSSQGGATVHSQPRQGHQKVWCQCSSRAKEHSSRCHFRFSHSLLEQAQNYGH